MLCSEWLGKNFHGKVAVHMLLLTDWVRDGIDGLDDNSCHINIDRVEKD